MLVNLIVQFLFHPRQFLRLLHTLLPPEQVCRDGLEVVDWKREGERRRRREEVPCTVSLYETVKDMQMEVGAAR